MKQVLSRRPVDRVMRHRRDGQGLGPRPHQDPAGAAADLDEAAAFNTAFLKDVAHNIAAAAELPSIAGYMAYGPPGSNAFFEGIFRRPSG